MNKPKGVSTVTPLMRRRRVAFVVLAGAILMVLGFGILMLALEPPWNRQVSVNLSRWTNGVALFTLANHGRFAIQVSPFCDRVDRQHRVLEPRPVLTDMMKNGRVTVRPGDSWSFSVAAPTGQGPWRLSVLCNRAGFRSKFSNWAGRSPRIRALLPRKYVGVPSDFIESEWVTE